MSTHTEKRPREDKGKERGLSRNHSCPHPALTPRLQNCKKPNLCCSSLGLCSFVGAMGANYYILFLV